MIGVSKNLQTKADFDLLHGLALSGDLRPQGIERLKQHWAGLLDSCWVYQFDRALGDAEQPDGPMPDYKVMEDEETGERQQFKRVEDATAQIAVLGFAAAEVQAKINELEAL